jgi:hypothetical protein
MLLIFKDYLTPPINMSLNVHVLVNTSSFLFLISIKRDNKIYNVGPGKSDSRGPLHLSDNHSNNRRRLGL